MRVKKANAILGTLLVVGGVVLLYLIADEDKGSLYGNPQAQQVISYGGAKWECSTLNGLADFLCLE